MDGSLKEDFHCNGNNPMVPDLLLARITFASQETRL